MWLTYLWEVALGIEDGDLSAAEKRLRQAQQTLQDALKNGASDAEIDKAMAELRAAMEAFMRELAQRQQNQESARNQQGAQELRQSDLERMMDQIENLAKSGDRDKAQELLSQLQNMMNNLQAGRQQGQQGQQDSEMRRQMDKLGDIMRRQQETMNETFRMDQMQRGQQRGQDGDQPFDENGAQGQMGQGEQGQQGQQGGQSQNGKPMTPAGIRRGAEAVAGAAGQAARRSRPVEEEPRRHGP